MKTQTIRSQWNLAVKELEDSTAADDGLCEFRYIFMQTVFEGFDHFYN